MSFFPFSSSSIPHIDLNTVCMHSFDSTLLPLTPETISHVLVQGGFSPSHPPQYKPIGSAYQPPRPSISHQDKFTTLLTRTLNVISSSDFTYVLDVCLDRATEVLFSSISPSAGGEWEFGDPSTADKGAGASTMNERVRLAALLPGLARWSQLALEGLPNVLVDVRFSFFKPRPCSMIDSFHYRMSWVQERQRHSVRLFLRNLRMRRVFGEVRAGGC